MVVSEMPKKLIRCYEELIKFKTYDERLRYLKLDGIVCHNTFGNHRYLNQEFYNSIVYRNFRDQIILRDKSCDLAIPGLELEYVIIHHMNPINLEDLIDRSNVNLDKLLDPNQVVCVSLDTHNAIHYGKYGIAGNIFIERTKNDTKLW